MQLVSENRLHRIARSLSDRDNDVLRSVADYGLLRAGHIQDLHFVGHATPDAASRACRRVLRRLGRLRVIEPIERRIGGIRAGSEGTVWRIGPVGDRLLRHGNPEAPRARRREPSLRFLEHRLLVADVACTLTRAAFAGDVELLDIAPEPSSWRRYAGLQGGREVLKPDLFALTAIGEYEDHWFIEVDRGTESLPTLLKQCEQYERYRRTGTEQQRSGVFPRVLWLVPDAHRRDHLRDAIERSQLDHQLYAIELHSNLLTVVTNPGAST